MEQKIYLPLQLKKLLPADVYKVADLLFIAQRDGMVTYAGTASVTSMHTSQETIERAIQTLIDRHIIISMPRVENRYWSFKINQEILERYRKLDWEKVDTAPVMEISSDITFKEEGASVQGDDGIDKMTSAEIGKLMKKLVAQLKKNEDEENKLLCNDLPF